jgi:hypothetical protein
MNNNKIDSFIKKFLFLFNKKEKKKKNNTKEGLLLASVNARIKNEQKDP